MTNSEEINVIYDFSAKLKEVQFNKINEKKPSAETETSMGGLVELYEVEIARFKKLIIDEYPHIRLKVSFDDDLDAWRFMLMNTKSGKYGSMLISLNGLKHWPDPIGFEMQLLSNILRDVNKCREK